MGAPIATRCRFEEPAGRRTLRTKSGCCPCPLQAVDYGSTHRDDLPMMRFADTTLAALKPVYS